VREGKILVRSSAGEYAVHVGPGLLDKLGERMRAANVRGRVALIVDEAVDAHWGEAARRSLAAAQYDAKTLRVPSGEASKSLAQADRLWTAMIEGGFSRSDTVVALGGGVIGDLAGFIAATFHRGMSIVQVPTTLLSQVDSSVGGKVAIDHPLGKNLIGAFHPPRLVVADTRTLSTLPARERWGGLAEVVKAALIADKSFLSELEQYLEGIGSGAVDELVLADVVERAVRIKADVVSRDEHETGPRMTLNFGHTIGHAIEAAAGYGPLLHGEAIVVGMRAALLVSERLGKLSAADARQAANVLGRFPRPPALATALSADDVKRALGRDKKAVAGKVRFIVLPAIGSAEIVPELPPGLLDEAIASALRDLGGSR
jgi:3-dehydroquinate synthase